MSRVLVDTSVWIEMFRKGDSPAIEALGELLRQGFVCTNGLIRAEILSGAKSKADYRRLQEHLSALPLLPDPPALWETIAETRYRLARKGFQAGIADMVVAATASYHRKALLTLDQAFSHIQRALRFELVPIVRH